MLALVADPVLVFFLLAFSASRSNGPCNLVASG
jgi:hypothetical protein